MGLKETILPESFNSNTLQEFPPPKRTVWTLSAMGGYQREGCAGCYYVRFFSGSPYKCRMREAVQSLLETVGPPSNAKRPQEGHGSQRYRYQGWRPPYYRTQGHNRH